MVHPEPIVPITEADHKFLESYGLKVQTPINYFTRQPALMVLYMALSMGSYSLYWFYRNWKAVQAATERKISPFWRTVFIIFWAWPLFKIMVLQSRYRGYPRGLTGGLLAAMFIITRFAGVADPNASPDQANTQLVYEVISSIIGALVLLTVQAVVLHNNERKLAEPFSQTVGWEYFWIAILCVLPLALNVFVYK